MMMPVKRRADEEGEEPAYKERRTEEMAEPKEPGEVTFAGSKEKERDDADDKRPTVTDRIFFHNMEMTLNVVTTTGGRVLMSMSDGGMQFLIAGARANAGVTSGRYFYEVKVIEALTPLEGRNPGRSRIPMPRQLVRIGFSLAKSSLVLGDGGDCSVCFDSEGYFCADKKRTPSSTRFGRDQDVGVLLNLDQSCPNANTISLFCNGQRISEPMPLPEKLRGRALFPHVSYRNVTLQVNFGPKPMSPLPFRSRMLQAAAAADVEEVRFEKPADGKYDVVFPVGFPDEGTFDWLDDFMEKHPNFVELSDRKILDWALKSGIWKPSSTSWKHSNDKPEFNFGIQFMDDFSIKRCLNALTCIMPRNYVVMEVKQNLTPADRKANLSRFRRPCFRKVASVAMGEPTAEHKARVQQKLLEEKRAKAEADWKARRQEWKKADGADEAMPQIELTEEEKKLSFRPPSVNDIAAGTLNASFAQFCVPEKQEGFDEVRFEWQDEETSKAYLRKWVLEKKVTARIEDLQPGEWFRTKYAEYQRSLVEWQAKQRHFKDSKRFAEARKPEGEDELLKRVVMDLDIDTLENICDMGNGEPLFSNFLFEDWTLLSLRYELFLLQAAYRKDVDDDERPGIHESHLVYYFSKYFKKQLSPRLYGKETPQEVIELVKDVVKIDPDKKVLVTVIPVEPPNADTFVKMQEESRRKRQQRIEAGDETARLNFQQPPEPQQLWSSEAAQAPQPPPPQYKGSGKEQLWSAETIPPPPPQYKGGGGKEQLWSADPAQPPPPQYKGGGGKDVLWPPAPRYSKGGGKPTEVPPPAPAGAPPPPDAPSSVPRLVPPPRPQPQQVLPGQPLQPQPPQQPPQPPPQQQQQLWKGSGGGGGKAGGKWPQQPQTYAPRTAKGGKKG